MVEMINKRSGNVMLVADDRVEEYKAAGHKLAAIPEKATPPKAPKKVRKKSEG